MDTSGEFWRVLAFCGPFWRLLAESSGWLEKRNELYSRFRFYIVYLIDLINICAFSCLPIDSSRKTSETQPETSGRKWIVLATSGEFYLIGSYQYLYEYVAQCTNVLPPYAGSTSTSHVSLQVVEYNHVTLQNWKQTYKESDFQVPFGHLPLSLESPCFQKPLLINCLNNFYLTS
jgi:hypothetical protein